MYIYYLMGRMSFFESCMAIHLSSLPPKGNLALEKIMDIILQPKPTIW